MIDTDSYTLLRGDCSFVLETLHDASIDAIVTDPPYHLTSIVKRFGGPNAAPAKPGTDGAFARASRGFMGKEWDGGDIAFRPELWAEALRVLKPGGHLIAFGGTRTYHRLAVAIEDAGFEIRDSLAWIYGQGMPKSHDVSKAIDKAAGAKREVVGHGTARGRTKIADGKTTFGDFAGAWDVTAPATPEAAVWEGWGTALKPALEPIVLARKPLAGTVAANVLEHGTGALNIHACRVGDEVRTAAFTSLAPCKGNKLGAAGTAEARRGTQGEPKEYVGRWPANVMHDGSEAVLAGFPETGVSSGGVTGRVGSGGVYNGGWSGTNPGATAGGFGDSGSAARFFYCAKPSPAERAGNSHPTVKPLALMRYLCRLVTPPGGLVLDPFTGSGTTGVAALQEGFRFVGIEREAEYAEIAERRLADALPDWLT